MPNARDITMILQGASAGEPAAVRDLFAAVYDDLRARARAYLASERPDHTLQATALVHEAYMRLIDQNRVVWQNRAHFLAVAGQAMRRILVDHARSRGCSKRSGGKVHLQLDDELVLGDEAADPVILALDDALTLLEAQEPEIARIVEMRFFGGLTQDECAALLGISRRTVCRHWDYAQAWLYREMRDEMRDDRA
jgi:RNA polymerase sigma factor (TIGR02999 family)